MPYGLRNAAQTFQRLMDRLLHSLPFIFIYLDDILAASPTLQDHVLHLQQLLTILRDNGLLVNTGADHSILPHSSPSPPTGPLLHTADNTPIKAWGTKQLALQFGPHTFAFSFVLANVAYPILGTDFLATHRLLVDPHRHQILYAHNLQPLLSSTTTVPPPH